TVTAVIGAPPRSDLSTFSFQVPVKSGLDAAKRAMGASTAARRRSLRAKFMPAHTPDAGDLFPLLRSGGVRLPQIRHAGGRRIAGMNDYPIPKTQLLAGCHRHCSVLRCIPGENR